MQERKMSFAFPFTSTFTCEFTFTFDFLSFSLGRIGVDLMMELRGANLHGEILGWCSGFLPAHTAFGPS
jgi:hypothetical protein